MRLLEDIFKNLFWVFCDFRFWERGVTKGKFESPFYALSLSWRIYGSCGLKSGCVGRLLSPPFKEVCKNYFSKHNSKSYYLMKPILWSVAVGYIFPACSLAGCCKFSHFSPWFRESLQVKIFSSITLFQITSERQFLVRACVICLHKCNCYYG